MKIPHTEASLVEVARAKAEKRGHKLSPQSRSMHGVRWKCLKCPAVVGILVRPHPCFEQLSGDALSVKCGKFNSKL